MKNLWILCFLLISFGINAQTTFSKDAWGNTVEKDEYGRTLSTYSKDPWGNTVKKDEYGRTISTFSQDAWAIRWRKTIWGGQNQLIPKMPGEIR